MTETTMETIEIKAKTFADARAALADAVAMTEADVAAIRKRDLPRIKELLEVAANAEADLLADVTASPGLFKRPKSRILHDVKLGWRKAPGKISFADAGAVVKRIRSQLPRRARDLIKVEEKPIKSALAQLSGDDLKKIGVTVTADSDEPFVAPTDSAVQKIVDALLESARDEGEAA